MLNWEFVSATLFRRLRLEALALDAPGTLLDLVNEVASYPGIQDRPSGTPVSQGVLVPVMLAVAEQDHEDP